MGVNIQSTGTGILYNTFEEYINNLQKDSNEYLLSCKVYSLGNLTKESFRDSILIPNLDPIQYKGINNLINRLSTGKDLNAFVEHLFTEGTISESRGWYEGLLEKMQNEKEATDFDKYAAQKGDLLFITKYGDKIYAICLLEGKTKGKDYFLLLLKKKPELGLYSESLRIEAKKSDSSVNKAHMASLTELVKFEIEKEIFKQINNN